MTKIFHNKSGFTLTEMAMVLMIMGIIASLGMAFLNARMSQTSYTVTKQRMAAIKESMISYLRVNSRLPCPDWIVSGAFTGQEVTTGAACSNGSFGILPYTTLGLSREQIIDGWGNFFSYRVDTTVLPGQTAPFWTSTSTISKNDSSLGNLSIQNTTTSGTTTASNVVAVISSHGPNGKGAYTIKATRNITPDDTDNPDENTNISATSTFYIDRPFSDNSTATGGTFDDIVGYMTVADLVGPLIKEGSTKSTAATLGVLSAQFERIKSAIIQHAASDLVDPNNCPYSAWKAGHDYNNSDTVVPTISNGHYYMATQPDSNKKTSNSEPTNWPTDPATPIIDLQVEWTDQGIIPNTDLNRHFRHRLPAGSDPTVLHDGTENGKYDQEGWVPYTVLKLYEPDVTDPWGNRIVYAVNADAAKNTIPAYNAGIYFDTTPKIAYRLISYGHINDSTHNTDTSSGVLLRGCNTNSTNVVISGADDICIDVLFSDIASAIINAGGRVDSLTCP